ASATPAARSARPTSSRAAGTAWSSAPGPAATRAACTRTGTASSPASTTRAATSNPASTSPTTAPAGRSRCSRQPRPTRSRRWRPGRRSSSSATSRSPCTSAISRSPTSPAPRCGPLRASSFRYSTRAEEATMPIPGNLLSPTTEAVDPNASGWAAKLNATLSKGVGGRNGDGCLIVKSVAAGEMQARTVSSYPVTAGTVYYCFADASGSVPERIGIRWQTATGTEISVSWSMATMAASASWHRVSVAAQAPVGATQAQVLLSSTPAGAGVNHFWENVYLGLPLRTLGNLLPFNTESSEVDASGWAPVVNA